MKPFVTRQPYILYERVLYKSRDEGYIPLQYARLRCVLIPHNTAAQGGQQRELPQTTYIPFAVCVYYSQYVQTVILVNTTIQTGAESLSPVDARPCTHENLLSTALASAPEPSEMKNPPPAV